MVDVALAVERAQSSTSIGKGSATGSTDGERPRSSKRSIRKSATSTTSVRPSSARSAAHRATAGPHIMPWPHAHATERPSTSTPCGRHDRAEQGEVVGRVLDRRRPRLADAESGGDGHELREAALHPPQVGQSSSRASPSGLVRIAHAPEQAALLQTPVQAGAACRRPSACRVDVEVRAAARSPRPGGVRRRPTAGRRRARPTSRSDGPPVSSTRSVAIVPAVVSTPVTRRRPPRAAAVRSPGTRVRSRSDTPAALHRERVRAHVARRIDAAVGRRRSSRRGGPSAASVGSSAARLGGVGPARRRGRSRAASRRARVPRARRRP